MTVGIWGLLSGTLDISEEPGNKADEEVVSGIVELCVREDKLIVMSVVVGAAAEVAD